MDGAFDCWLGVLPPDLPVQIVGLQRKAVGARKAVQNAPVGAAQFDAQLTAGGIGVQLERADAGRQEQGFGHDHPLAGRGEGDEAISLPGGPPQPLDALLHVEFAVRMLTAGVVPVNFVAFDDRLFGCADDHAPVEGAAGAARERRGAGAVGMLPVDPVAAVYELAVDGAVAGNLVLFARDLLGGHVEYPQQTEMDPGV